MNKRRGKALTGEFKNEVLHFGKLLAQFENIVFFSVSLGGQEGQSFAVVLENFDIEKCELSPRAYADKINLISEKNSFIAPIVELGITPDGKPFFISNEPSGSSLDEYVFVSKEEFKRFFIGLFRAFLALRKDDICLTKNDLKMIYPDSIPSIVFPAIESILINSLQNLENLELDSDVVAMKSFAEIFLKSYNHNIQLFAGKTIDKNDIVEFNPGEFFAFLEILGDSAEHEEAEEERSKSIELIHNISGGLRKILPIIRYLILKFLALPPKMQMGIGVASVVLLFIISGMTSGPTTESVGTEPVKQMTKALLPEKEQVKQPEKELGKQIQPKEVDPTELPQKGTEGVRSAEIREILSKIQSMGRVISEDDLDFLIDNLKSDDFEVRIASIRTLGEKAPKDLVTVKNALVDCLKDEDYLVRGFAVSSLAAYLEADSLTILESHKVSEENEVVVAAIERAIDRLSSFGKVR